MKKVLSLILALLMTASCASAIFADDAAIDEAAEEAAVEEVAVVEEAVAGPYDKAIEFLNNYGIYKGKSADDLAAEDAIERYQMALFVARISTGWVDDEQWEDGPENWSEFTDISEGPVANYWGALSYANSKGIIEGYGNGKFGPSDGITYQNALTMVVRTLGYQGLEWPWGYIEKAVSLGLTDGITGVAYTDELNRGEVAQVIYNALFAPTKSGETLALKSFGIEFGWEKVVIVASDLDTFVADTEKSAKALEANNAYNYYKDSAVKTDDSGKNGAIIAFKLLNDDGTLGDDTYYAYAADFGLSGADHAHDDEAVVGDAYYVLFEKDADSTIVKTVAYESLLVDTLWNAGRTDDNGEAQDYAIEDFKADYALVSKYSSNAYVNVTASTKPEVIVYVANADIIDTKVVADHNIAIDWATGDILKYVLDDDGNKVDEDEDGFYDYTVAWYYLPLLDKYYQYNTDKSGNIVGINYMTDKEFEDYYASVELYRTVNYKGFAQTNSLPKTAYASLKLYDTNLNGVADRGIFEEYRLGYFEPTTINVWCGHGAYPSYTISRVSGSSNAAATFKALGETDAADADILVNAVVEGTGCAHTTDRVWFVEGYEPLKDADGNYVKGYIIYSYDKETGAIKVVKNIADGADEDTFVATGVVRAYNASNATVTIGDTQYKADYNELAGTGFYKVNVNAATKAAYTARLRDLFNQFVEYVVVDGKLVAMKAVGQTKSELIVVDSYAGLSSDGYIVVNGYSTADLKYDQFRIGSYNNWMKGDYYYYLTEAKAKESFSQGAIYAISSYDADEDVYYVQLAGEFNYDEQRVPTYTVDTDYATLTAVSIKALDDGYMTYTVAGTAADKKMSSEDKYVIIPKDISGTLTYAPIYVYEGKLQAGWEVSGQELGSTTDRTYVIVNATGIVGFQDAYKSSLVVLLDDTYYSADYNGADAEDWYLLGASKVEVAVFDIMTGTFDKVYAGTNVDLKVGHMYYAVDGVIVEDVGVVDATAIVEEVNAAYGDADTYYADYVVLKDGVHYNVKDATRFDNIEDDFLVGKVTADGYSNYHGDKVTGTKYFVVEYDSKGVITDITEYAQDKVDDYAKKNDITTLVASLVYNVANGQAYFYINPDAVTTTVESDLLYTNPVKVWGSDSAYIEARFGYKTITTDVAGTKTVEAIIDGIELSFAGYDVEKATHANVEAEGWFFGYAGECDWERIVSEVYFDGAELHPVFESIVEKTYGDHTEDVDGCHLIKTVYIPLVDGETVNGKFVAKDVVINDDDAPDCVQVNIYSPNAEAESIYAVAYVDLSTQRPAGYTVNDGFVANYKVASDVYAFIYVVN